MNLYYNAMEHCVPPEGLRKRMEERVLSSPPQKVRPFKPKGFRKKAAIVLLASVFLLLTVSATTIWDPLFIRRFGPGAALSALGGAVFQEVNVTSVCGDVSLTVTQALCSDKTIYLLLEYKLPDDVQPPKDWSGFPNVIRYYGTGDYTWEQFEALEGDDWKNYDWSEFTSYCDYFYRNGFPLTPYDICSLMAIKEGRSSSGSVSIKGFDAETNTITWIISHYFDTDWDLSQQPLTILVSPPYLENEDGTKTAVTNHPAIVTFQPAYSGPQSRSGTLEEGGVKISATLSTFSLSLRAEGMGYLNYQDMVNDTWLIAQDGTEKPASLMGYTSGGGGIGPEECPLEVNTIVHFIGLTDISSFTALRMGKHLIPLE